MDEKKTMKETIDEYQKLRESDPTTKTQDVVIKYPHTTRTVQVDALIASCIQACNDAGFWTKYCCSGHEIDYFCGGYVMFDIIRNPISDLLSILNDIQEFAIERSFKYDSIDGNFKGIMKNPTDEQIEDFKRCASSLWNTPIIYRKRVIVRMSHETKERRDPVYRDENLESTKKAFAKLEVAVKEYQLAN